MAVVVHIYMEIGAPIVEVDGDSASLEIADKVNEASLMLGEVKGFISRLIAASNH